MRKVRKKANPFAILLAAVLSALLLFLMTLFFLQGKDFFIFSLFDSFFMYESEASLTLPTEVRVNVYPREGAERDRLSEDAERCISNYFTLYYSALGGQKMPNYKQVFAFQSEDMLYSEAELELLIEIRKRGQGLTFSACDVGLLYNSVSEVDTIMYNITLTENAAFSFELNNGYSTVSEVKHNFILEKNKTDWEIKEHTSSANSLRLVSDEINKAIEKGGYTRAELSYSYLPKYIDEALEALLSETEQGNAVTEFPSAEYPYLRQNAVDYAHNYVGEARKIRNIDSYSEFENNSTNFISQCLFAAEIPMDDQGESKKQWKWYGDKPNTRREKVGYSASWVDGNAFLEYCRSNDGFGLVSVVGADYSLGEIGDIIQYINGSDVVFQALITGIVSDENGASLDYLITSNSDDLLDFPASAVGVPNRRLIKIIGYNT